MKHLLLHSAMSLPSLQSGCVLALQAMTLQIQPEPSVAQVKTG